MTDAEHIAAARKRLQSTQFFQWLATWKPTDAMIPSRTGIAKGLKNQSNIRTLP